MGYICKRLVIVIWPFNCLFKSSGWTSRPHSILIIRGLLASFVWICSSSEWPQVLDTIWFSYIPGGNSLSNKVESSKEFFCIPSFHIRNHFISAVWITHRHFYSMSIQQTIHYPIHKKFKVSAFLRMKIILAVTFIKMYYNITTKYTVFQISHFS